MRITTKRVRRQLYVVAGTASLTVMAMLASGHAKADPYCGQGMNWDWRHQVCQPGNPVPPGGPGVGVFPYPLPNQSGGPGAYGGN